MRDPAREQIEGWRSVAPGWERRRDTLWRATRSLSERLVDLLDLQPGETLLELAAGSGDTTFLAAPRLEPGGRVLCTDAAPEMLAAAASRAADLGVTNVEFLVVDAAATGFADASVDAALCRFGVMLVPDCDAAARELCRVVRPGGRVSLAVWASAAENPWMSAGGRAAVELGLVERPPRDAPGPFRLADPVRLRLLLERAGLEVDVLEDAGVTWRADSLDEWWAITIDTSRMLGELARHVDDETLSRLRARASELLREHTAADGSLAVPGRARVVRARRPPAAGGS